MQRMTLRDEPRRLLSIEVAALTVLTGALWFAGGTAGVGIAGIVAGTWFVAGMWFDVRSVYGYAAGQLLVIPLLTAGAELGELLVVQLGLAGLLGASLLGRWSLETAIIALVTFSAATATLSTLHLFDPLTAGVVLLFGGYAVIAYGLYRYERGLRAPGDEGSERKKYREGGMYSE